MYDDEEEETSEASESESEEESISYKRKRTKTKKTDKNVDNVTWVEAAEIVLSRYDHPLQHKEILRLIEESELKTTGRGNSAPLAVLNSMLNSNSKGSSPTFYRSPTGTARYGLMKNRAKSLAVSESTNVKTNSASKATKSYADFKKEHRIKQKLTPPSTPTVTKSLKIPGQKYVASSLRVKKPLIPPGASTSVNCSRRCNPPLGTLSKAAYYERLKQQPQHRRMGPTTSAMVRPAPPFSRPPPGAALRVMPPKKRVKIDQDENDSDSSSQSKNDYVKEIPRKSSQQKNNEGVTLRKESQRNHDRIAKSVPKLVARSGSSNSPTNTLDKTKSNRPLPRPARTVQRSTPPSRVPNKALPPMKKSQSSQIITTKRLSTGSTQQISNTTNENKDTESGKQTFFVGVKFKKLKKGNQADQLKRGGKESKIDLMTPDSVLTSIHIKDLFNASTFKLLPEAYQYQLLMLLPDCDRVTERDGALRPSPHSLNNGFFSRACQEYKDKLLDGDLNSDILQRAKQEVKTYSKLDPWKVKYFEPAYGQSSKHNDEEVVVEKPPPNIPPVDSSWVAFLKFAENSTGDFEEALAKLQAEVQKVAAKEAKEKEEEEQRRKEDSMRKSKLLPTVKLTKSHRTSTVRPSPARPSPKSHSIDKEKSKKALKKAQLLQRKKAIGKQLKDAKAKIVEEARSGARKDEESQAKIIKNSKTPVETTTISCDTSILNSSNNIKSNVTTTPLTPLKIENTVKAESVPITRISDTSANNSTSAPTPPPILDLSNSLALKRLIQDSEIKAVPKKPISNNAKQKKQIQQKQQQDSKTISRVVHGAATFGTNSNGACPCNVKAMFLCKQCGSAWHGDCINSDKICISCS